ncbi:uncharacterized protein LOC126664705 [Mercurialis annua]|uniref:uncharacterized protein LOC126664705 n=1 Tax=Mercurialis annua TaxID=3986 RepID=UPI00215FD6DB|nr:uncharacterized protein LOC126664705 [Mercurialis annua]
MELQSVCRGFTPPNLTLSAQCLSCRRIIVSTRLGSSSRTYRSSLSRRVLVHASSSNSSADTNLQLSYRQTSGVPVASFDGLEPFRGNSGSVSFCGLTHQSVEARKLVSAPFSEDKGSFLWVLGPIALLSSLFVPQFYLNNAIESFIKDAILVEIVSSLFSEAMFYAGVSIFLLVTDRIQRPYLQFSPKSWGLVTGLKGYLTSAFFAMGFKVIAPLLVVFITWPVLRLPALVAVLPFLAGCIAQRIFEIRLDQRGSSCWPLVPIIFEVYRIYQLTKATHFIEKLMFAMRELPESPQLFERNNALIVMIVTFQVLGVVCLWSLLTFFIRLFPSRPVAENY